MNHTSIAETPHIHLNPALQVCAFDESSDSDKVLCEIPTQSGESNRVTLTASVFELLKKLSKHYQFEQLRADYMKSELKHIEWEKFEHLIEHYFIKNKLLVTSDETDFTAPSSSHNKVMSFQLPLMGERLVNPIASRLVFLYRPFLVVTLLALFVALQFNFYIFYEPYVVLSFDNLTAQDAFQCILLVIAGMFIHEFGHVTAAHKYRCRKMSIGLGWYLYFFVFYADLSESWKLPRRQRVTVDAGGLYFQSIYMSLLAASYIYISAPAIFYSLLILSVSFIWNLNPFLKMDGYWMVSDLTGITNLRHESSKVLKNMFAHLTRRKIEVKSSLTKKTQLFLSCYSVLSNLFFAILLYVMTNRVSVSVTHDLPNRIEKIANSMSGELQVGDFLISCLVIVFQCIVVLVILKILFKTLKNVAIWLYNQTRSAINSKSSLKTKS